METRTVRYKVHVLFDNEDEFRRKHSEVELVNNWRDGAKGSWVKTDDGRVCQVLHRGQLHQPLSKGKKIDYVRTVIGTFVCRPSQKMEGAMRDNMYSLGGKSKIPYHQRKSKKNVTKREFLFATYVAKGEDPVQAYLKAFPTEKYDYADRESKMLLTAKRIQSVVREEVEKMLYEEGVTPRYVIRFYYELLEDDNVKVKDKVNILRVLSEITGLRGDASKRVDTLTVFKGFTSEQIEALGKGDTKKLAETSSESAN